MWQLPPNQTCPLTAFPRLMKHEAAVYTSLTHTRTQLQNEPLLPHLCHMTVTWMLCGGSGGCVQQTRCYVWLGSFHLTAPAQETRSSCTTADAHRDPTTPITNSPPTHVLLLSRAKEGDGPHPLYDSFRTVCTGSPTMALHQAIIAPHAHTMGKTYHDMESTENEV